MPLRAQPRVEHPLIQDRQYVDYDHAHPQQARDRVLQAVHQLDDGRGSWRAGDNPFPGLEPFTAARSGHPGAERRRRTRTITVLSTLLVLALIAAGIAVWQQQRASDAQRITIARSMVAQADRIRDNDPRGALQLGVAARQFDASPQTHASLRQTLTSTSHFTTLRSHTDAVWGIAFAPDGRTPATASDDQTVRLWDLSDRDRPRQLGQPLTGHTNPVNAVAFTPDGHTLATASADQTAILWQPPRLDAFPDGEVREACLRAGGPLDKATWDQFAPGVGYQDTCADR